MWREIVCGGEVDVGGEAKVGEMVRWRRHRNLCFEIVEGAARPIRFDEKAASILGKKIVPDEEIDLGGRISGRNVEVAAPPKYLLMVRSRGTQCPEARFDISAISWT